MIHLWCVLPRHDAIYTELLDKVDKGLPPPLPSNLVLPAALCAFVAQSVSQQWHQVL